MSSLGDINITNGISFIVTATDKWCKIDGALKTQHLAILMAKARILMKKAEVELEARASKTDGLEPGEFISMIRTAEVHIEQNGGAN